MKLRLFLCLYLSLYHPNLRHLSFPQFQALSICLSVCLAISTCRTSICGTHMPTEIFHGILTGRGRGNGKGNLQQRQVNFQLRAQRANRSQRAKLTRLPKTGGQSQSKPKQSCAVRNRSLNRQPHELLNGLQLKNELRYTK